MTDCHHYTHT